MAEHASLVLGSASPRRKELLGSVGLRFDVVVREVDERRLDGEAPPPMVLRLARLKLLAVMPGIDEAFVLTADTIVVVDEEVLGKPVDAAEGLSMLERLSGRVHEVTTAVALGRAGAILEVESTTTKVHFCEISSESMAAYVATAEGTDKAGGYAIQGIAGGFVTHIEGSYSNVVGLPTAQTVALLERHGALWSWP